MSSLPVPTRVACYARVSTEDQAERQTVAAQTDFLRRYCDLHGLPVAGVYIDDGVSGTTALEDRPEGRRLLEDAESGAFSVVLVYRLDRLGRSLKSLLAAHERLERAGVAIRSGTEPFDTASPIGKFLFSLLGSMAELERATISERMTMGRDRVAREGKYTGGPIPLGFTLTTDNHFMASERIIAELDVTEAEYVRDLFRRVASGETSLNAERIRLSALNVPRCQRYGGASGKTITRTDKWSLSSLSTILHNPVYKGVSVVQSSHGTIERPAEPLVDADTWTRAGVALARNRNMSRKNAKHDYLLRGLVTCGQCGFTYTGGAASAGGAYRCNGSAGLSGVKRGPRCIGAQVSARALEGVVWRAVREFVDHPDEHIAEAQRQLRERLASASKSDEQRKRLTRDLAGKEQGRERVLGMFRRGRISSDEAEHELDAIAAEAAQLRDLIHSLSVRVELAAAQEEYLSNVGAALAHVRDRVDEIERANDRVAMREQIELLVPRIVVHTENVGTTPGGRTRKRTSVHLTLAFAQENAVVSITGSHAESGSASPPSGTAPAQSST